MLAAVLTTLILELARRYLQGYVLGNRSGLDVAVEQISFVHELTAKSADSAVFCAPPVGSYNLPEYDSNFFFFYYLGNTKPG